MIALNSWLKSALAATTVAGVLAACTVTTGPDTDTPDLDIDSGTRVDSGTTTDSGTADAGDADVDAGPQCALPASTNAACDECIVTQCANEVCGCFDRDLPAGDYSCASYDDAAYECLAAASDLPEAEQQAFYDECIEGLDETFASNGAAGAIVANDALYDCADAKCQASCVE